MVVNDWEHLCWIYEGGLSETEHFLRQDQARDKNIASLAGGSNLLIPRVL